VKRTSKFAHSTLNELNITALLDLAFVLLVIFIITTPQLVNNLEMFLPSGKPPPPANPDAPKPKINRIVVDATGQVFLNDKAVSVPMLTQELKELKAADPQLGVVVKGSDDADYQHMVTVLDIIQQLDITKVGLATDAVSASPGM
jgi:biopolymer transport protein ExbD